MSARQSATKPASHHVAASRPIWLHLKGARIVPLAKSGKVDDEAIYWTREGDDRWHPIATLLAAKKGG